MPDERTESELIALRREIRDLDDAMVALLAQRQALARRVGEAKLALGLPIHNAEVEQEVIGHARMRAAQLGLHEDQAEEAARMMIRYACLAQSEQRRRAKRVPTAKGRRILVIGGLGRMGRWLGQYFSSCGHEVTLWDIRAANETEVDDLRFAPDLPKAMVAADVVVLSTPISETAQWIVRAAEMSSRALVFDICSLKSPLLGTIEKARQSGLRITSVHPMFGPNVLHLAGRNILLCDTGDHALTDEATGLFEDSGANLVRVPLARHDELMQYVLGLSHLTGMVFAEALVASGMELSELWKVAAPSFVAQARATEVVVRDNQDLYYEIQTENGATPTMLEGMKRALDLYKKAIEEGDRSGFKALMARGRDYFRVSHDTGME